MQKQIDGVVGFFDNGDALISAASRVREHKGVQFDTFTPFPVHGIFEAQGVPRSILPVLVFVGGLTGCTLGFFFQWWTSAKDWPIIIGGKPYFSGPAFIPVTFELTILFSALTTVIGMILLNRLPNMKRRAIDPAITRDRFALLIEAPPAPERGFLPDELAPPASAPHFDEAGAKRILESVGAKEIRTVTQEGWFS